MPVQLTMCRLCARSRPDFIRALRELLASHPDELLVEELECMAACDDVPAIMIETDFYAQVQPQELSRLVQERLGAFASTPDS